MPDLDPRRDFEVHPGDVVKLWFPGDVSHNLDHRVVKTWMDDDGDKMASIKPVAPGTPAIETPVSALSLVSRAEPAAITKASPAAKAPKIASAAVEDHPPKRKGGWPKGKPRGKKATAPAEPIVTPIGGDGTVDELRLRVERLERIFDDFTRAIGR